MDNPDTIDLLRAFVLRYAEGDHTAGQVKEALGLSFQQTEEFLYAHAAHGLGPKEHLQGLQHLRQSQAE